MNRDEMDSFLASDKYITGIYNYCDRWCERCPQTLRCLNHSLTEKHMGSDAETGDLTNEIFWQKIT
jgi:hypothetical protein